MLDFLSVCLKSPIVYEKLLFSKPSKSDWMKALVFITKKHLKGCFLTNGAPGRNRTGTSLRTTDFKSAASTCSATGARYECVIQRKYHKCNIKLVSFHKICFVKNE